MLDDPHLLLPEIWTVLARFQRNKTALICGERRRSWGEFNGNLNRVANRLLAAGLKRGERVAVLMSNSIEMVEVMFGIVKAGGCVVPLSTLLVASQVETLLKDSDSVGLFASPKTLALAEEALKGCPAVRDDLRILHGDAAKPWQPLDAWLLEASIAEPGLQYRLEDEFNIIYSSGTTGIPKGIVQTHRARQHFALSNALEMRFNDSSVALVTTSLYSNGSWFMLIAPFFVGATSVIMEEFNADKFLELVARERVTHTFMVPTQFQAVLAAPGLEKTDTTSLQTMLTAGSPLHVDTKAQVQRRFGPVLFELYGFSEGLATIIKPGDIGLRPKSVGKPLVGWDLRIIDDDGKELAPNEAGEIAGYGPGMMREYHRRPDATQECIWRDERGRVFLRSGDIGYLDEDGFLYILDRKKDMIKTGGLNVFPADIESVLAQHPDVAQVTVIGVPHDKWGETPLGLVVLRAGCGTPLEDIRLWANDRLAKTQRLSALEARTDLPRNALGKVLKRQLREPYWSSHRG